MGSSRVGVVALLSVMSTGCIEDPFAIDGPRSCEIPDQNDFVLRVMEEVYLWNDELPTVDTDAFESPQDLLLALRNPELDRWSRISDKVTMETLFEEGKFIGLGMSTRRDGEGRLRISWVHTDSPAGRAGFGRGDVVDAINGLSIAEIDSGELWGDIYGEKLPGVVVRVDVTTVEGADLSVSLEKDWVEIATVPVHHVFSAGSKTVGYIMFATFVETAFEPLDRAFEDFQAAGVDEVVLDMRYNGGGRIAVAQHIVDLLIGAQAEGQVSYRTEYNDDFKSENTSRKISKASNSLGLTRVVFVTTGNTLSASELVINAVSPYAEVVTIGTTTGGKPYGSHGWEFCDQICGPLTFRLLNGAGVTDYVDGFLPTCLADDDFLHELGDTEEASLLTAITYLESGECLPPDGAAPLDPADDDAEQLRRGIVPEIGAF